MAITETEEITMNMRMTIVRMKMARRTLMTRKDDGQDEDDISGDEEGEVCRTKCLENICCCSLKDSPQGRYEIVGLGAFADSGGGNPSH